MEEQVDNGKEIQHIRFVKSAGEQSRINIGLYHEDNNQAKKKEKEEAFGSKAQRTQLDSSQSIYENWGW